jgi:hypothetical protein
MGGMTRVVAMSDFARQPSVGRSVSTPAWVGLRTMRPAIHPAQRRESPPGSGIRVVMNRARGRMIT